jgi:hypothetical protein
MTAKEVGVGLAALFFLIAGLRAASSYTTDMAPILLDAYLS